MHLEEHIIMKTSSYVLVFSLLVLMVSSSVSWALSDSIRANDFIHCLLNTSQPSYPITNAIYTPHNSSFFAIFDAYARNHRFLTPTHPNLMVIVAAMHESHVQAAVVCSKAHGLMLRTRSGGHDWEGLSYRSLVPFVILDMFNLRELSIDLESETMWVQSGATLGEVYYNIAAKSKTLAFPAGVCPSVGLGGHLSGAGFGFLVRKYGITSDNVIDATVVDANGRMLDRKAMGEDMFWAINGGGGASFGVILSWKLKLVKVPETVTVIMVNRTTDQGATQIIRRWQEVAPNISDDLFIRLELRAVQKSVRATFIGLFLGKIEQLLPLMKKSFPELGLQRADCSEMSWVESTLFFYAFPKGTPTEALLDRVENDTRELKSKSDFVKERLTREDLENIWQNMTQIGEVLMQWNPYGGQMNQIPSTQTPAPHRAGYLFKIQYLVYWTEKSKDDYYLDLSRKLFSAMTPYVTKNPREAFLNYRDLDIGSSPYANATYDEASVYGKKYFSQNFDRLVQVKTKVDPDNFFRNEQSIPVFSNKN